MPKTTQMGFLVLGALLLAAIFVVALVLLLNVGIIQGLVLLAIIDALIIMGGYLMTKRIARANQRDTGP